MFTFTGSFMEAIEEFLIPPPGCYRFYRWISGRASSRKACMELPALQGNSIGGCLPLALPAGQTDTSQGLLCADSYNQKSFSSKFGSSVESGTLTVQWAEKLGGSWIPVLAHEQLWIVSCFSIVPTCSFLSVVQVMFQ